MKVQMPIACIIAILATTANCQTVGKDQVIKTCVEFTQKMGLPFEPSKARCDYFGSTKFASKWTVSDNSSTMIVDDRLNYVQSWTDLNKVVEMSRRFDHKKNYFKNDEATWQSAELTVRKLNISGLTRNKIINGIGNPNPNNADRLDCLFEESPEGIRSFGSGNTTEVSFDSKDGKIVSINRNAGYVYDGGKIQVSETQAKTLAQNYLGQNAGDIRVTLQWALPNGEFASIKGDSYKRSKRCRKVYFVTSGKVAGVFIDAITGDCLGGFKRSSR